MVEKSLTTRYAPEGENVKEAIFIRESKYEKSLEVLQREGNLMERNSEGIRRYHISGIAGADAMVSENPRFIEIVPKSEGNLGDKCRLIEELYLVRV